MRIATLPSSTPGHEIAGVIAELGEGVEGFAVGDPVAVGWFGGNCTRCDPCRRGLLIHGENLQVPSWQYPGGYAESLTAPATALARIPDELSFAEAAPLCCAGVTTFNSTIITLQPGDIIATGTPGGVGQGRNPKVFLQPGQELQTWIEGIGELRNTVVKDAAA